MGRGREAVGVVVSLACVAAVGFLAFAWWERVTPDGDPESGRDEINFCVDMFRNGQRMFPSAEPVSCWNEGHKTVVVTKQYRCENGTTLFANDYGWWSTEDNWLRVPSDRGGPPRAVVDHCVSL